jgi:hypothetical protein
VSTLDLKADLHEYLRSGREVMLWKLDGLTEYDMRRPLVPTGTNLLGLLRHVATAETLYFGTVFARPFPEAQPWMGSGEANSSMWVPAAETSGNVVDFCRRAWAYSDDTIDTLALDARGDVPWWPEGHREISLHRALVHVAAEIYRHAGHADIIRELIDGSVGADRRWSNLPPRDESWWKDHRNKVEIAAVEAGEVISRPD